VLLVVLGSLMAVLGCFAGIGFTAILDIKLSVLHFTLVPFFIIGISLDDMFMLALSHKTVEGGASPKQFPEVFASVAVPVTMTSLVNATMFAIISLVSDVAAVYQVGYTGLIATLIIYLTMMLSFPAVIYMDSVRRAAGRFECLPCKKSADTTRVDDAIFARACANVYQYVFKPLLTTLLGRALTALVALAFLVLAVVAMANDIPLGLDLPDFFPVDTAPGKFAEYSHKYFASWPVTLNWGQLAYNSPDVQMRMAYQFEQVLASRYIADKNVPTTLVWTAAFAVWGLNQNTSCKSTWTANTYGLKLEAAGGVCRSQSVGSICPVLADLSETQFAQCFKQWAAADFQKYAVSAPGMPMDIDGTPSLPIRYSQASGSVLFAFNLFDTKDYTNMIKETRKYTDDDQVLKAWMSGVPFDFWEQYLTIVKDMFKVGGISIACGCVVSFGFLLMELTLKGQGTWFTRTFVSALGSGLIAVVSIVSLVVVVCFLK
jgi:hypothetical protein